MKPFVVNIVLLAALCVAGYCYTQKFSAPDNIDLFKAGLKGASAYLRPGSSVKIKYDIPDDIRYGTFAAWFLAPAVVKRTPPVANDTLLIISPAGMADTGHYTTIIWQGRDTGYRYTLVRK